MLGFEPPRATAWAPWRKDREWLQRRDARACSWVLERATEENVRAVVQGDSHADDYRDGDGPIAKVARMGTVATLRSPVGRGAIIVPNAGIRLLATGARSADGNSVVATESPAFPLRGWAMATEALNLETGERTEDSRTASQIQMLEAFVGQLYNGWAHKQVGRRASAHYLPKLVESGMTYDVFVGSVLAIDPGHLDTNSDIDEMYKALPPAWADERAQLSRRWRG